MIPIAEAEHIMTQKIKDYGITTVSIEQAIGHTLAQPLIADRDMPPYDRVTMDGIAIAYNDWANGIKTFNIIGTQAAGQAPIELTEARGCIEIMTGAALPKSCDTIIRYEDLTIENGNATINAGSIKQGQNIHTKGMDKQAGELLAEANQIITPALINIAASVGLVELTIRKQPRIAVLSNGDELVPIDATPSPYEVRRSNSYTIASILQQHQIKPDIIHLPDDDTIILEKLQQCLENYDVLLISGGVSAGKYDYLPNALEQLSVKKLFHKVKQRPGKPFWFGEHEQGTLVFSFPGNPVSTFMCMYRHFIPWLNVCNQISNKPIYAVLDSDYTFKPELQYFLQVKINTNNNGQLVATPYEGNGSGDFVNLLYTDAFMELPAERATFNKGETYRIWPYKPLHT